MLLKAVNRYVEFYDKMTVIHTHTYIHIHTYTHTHTYTYIHIHTQTYTHATRVIEKRENSGDNTGRLMILAVVCLYVISS